MEGCALINWTDYFVYDSNSETGLRWAVDILAGKTGKTKIVARGDAAGCFTSNKNGTRKCIDVRVNGRLYKAHRIIYEMVCEEIPPGMVVDHKDQNPWNNRIENLRVIPKKKNHRNTKRVSSNTSGKTGVHWHTMNKGKHTYAVGRVMVDSKEYSARFGTHHHGLLPSFLMACEWRDRKVTELNATLDAGFTELHGQNLQ